MTALTDLTRIQSLLPGLTESDRASLQTILMAVSAQVERWCGRHFHKAKRTVIISPSRPGHVCLPDYPVSEIQTIAGPGSIGIHLSRLRTTSSQIPATVQVTKNEIHLSTWDGISSYQKHTFTWVEQPTLQSLATAISQLDDGWQAAALPSRHAWPTAALVPVFATIATAGQTLPILVFDHFFWDWQLEAATGICWQLATNLLRIDYIAGFDPIPEDLQHAVAVWTISEFQRYRSQGSYQSERLGDYAYTRGELPSTLPVLVQQTLNTYRDIRF